MKFLLKQPGAIALCLTIASFFFVSNANAQLSAGDIAITGMNTDGTDGISFVLLAEMQKGQIITFDEKDTDGLGGMTGTGGQMTITFTCLTPAGTVIGFDADATFVGGFTNGTIEETGTFSLTGSNEFVYAYEGGVTTTPTTFLAAAANDNYALSGTNSLASTGLTSGTHAWEYDVFGSPDEDIMYYNGTTSGKSAFSGFLSEINGTGGNWISQDASGDQSNDLTTPDFASGTSYDLPSEFTITTNCTAPSNQPTTLTLTPHARNIYGNFSAAVGSPSGYLIVKYASGATTTNPVDGTHYCIGDAIGSGNVESVGNVTSFVDYNLSPSTTYDYYIYAFNSECNGQPNYLTTSPLTASGTTTASLTTIVNNSAAIGPSDVTSRAAATALNDDWETDQQNSGVGCNTGWTTVYGSLSFTNPTGTITGLTQTNITSGSGAGISYSGTVQFQLKNFELDPDNSLGEAVVDEGTVSGGSISSSTTVLQDNAPSPDGVDEYFTHGTLAISGRTGVEITLSDPVDVVGFFLGDVETTTANNGSNPFTPAVVVSYDNSGNELDRVMVTTASAGQNCTGTTTAGAAGCGSQETVWVSLESSTANIAKIQIITGDYVSDTSLTPNAGEDRGKNEFISFGGFTLGGSCTAPLPVKLVDFTARVDLDKTVSLEWLTSAEVENSHFEVQKSFDGIKFQSIGVVQGNGNSQILNQYQFTDLATHHRTIYYRLKQFDFNGTYEYSKVITVNIKEIGAKYTFNIFPNPSKGELNIKGDLSAIKSIDILDAYGKVAPIEFHEGQLAMPDLENGMYWIVVEDQNGHSTHLKFIKL